MPRLFDEGFYVLDDNDEQFTNCFDNIDDGRFLFLTIIPTYDCNFRCEYCWESFNSSANMDTDVINNIVQLIEKRKETIKYLEISWFGGEPLLQTELIKAMSEKLRPICAESDIALRQKIATNGYLLTPTNLEILKKSGLSSLVVTLDGPRDIHNQRRFLSSGGETFDVILNNIKNIDFIDRIDIAVNCDEKNVEHIDVLLDDLTPLKRKITLYYRWVFPPIDEWKTFYNTDELEQYNKMASSKLVELNWKAIKKGYEIRNPLFHRQPFYCKSDISNHYLIGTNGEVFKCNVEFENKLAYGSLNNNGTIEMNDIYHEVWHNAYEAKTKKCTNCIFVPKCHGGCAYAFIVSGKNKCKFVSLEEAKEYIKMMYYFLSSDKETATIVD